MSFDAPAAPVAAVNITPAASVDVFGGSSSASPGSSLDVFNMNGVQSSLPPSGFSFDGMGLAPLPITTPEFGSRWGTCKCEQKTKASPKAIRSVDEYMSCMEKNGFHPVQAIPTSKSLYSLME